jgi:diacylglycerol kinase (ATP)
MGPTHYLSKGYRIVDSPLTSTRITALLLLNANSRSGDTADIHEGVSLLKTHGISVIQKKTSSAQQTEQLIQEYSRQIQLVILGGGDGTISAAAGSLYQHQLPFAILPLGTANDLAHSLNIPTNLTEAFQLIINSHKSRINLGVVNKRYFFNAAHIGLGVKVASELTPEVKKALGVFSYLKAAFTAFKKNRPFHVSVKVDGKSYKLHSIEIAVGNGRYYGGGNVIDKGSEIDDGKLCLYSLAPSSFWSLLGHSIFLRYGEHGLVRNTFTTSGKRIEIIVRKAKDIIADGELISKTPAVFEVIPEALEVIRPLPE